LNIFSRYVGPGMIRRLRKRVLPNLGVLVTTWQVRHCRCCERVSLHLQFGPDEEYRKCLRCTANLRYEMQAEYLRDNFALEKLDILELDPNSCLRPLLERGKSYIRTYFRPGHVAGTIRDDGSIMEDITHLTFRDASLDLIVSSDVLEHVPDVRAAFRESFRVLRAAGVHVFTVPFEPRTFQRAAFGDGVVHYFAEPEYHADPLDPLGILAFWHFGPDLQQQFGDTGLIFALVKGPEGARRSVVWEARKPA
jgi:Methyltransferase domain